MSEWKVVDEVWQLDPISGIDWDELSAYKAELVQMLSDKPDSNVWGIVNLIDAIQDYYEPIEERE